ncbi:GIY-YIG nuclease family protein [Deinococcus alpinitundrae]|uniref:GIY-YIG nuclease family protein n=1 Tax=Deinococcus alpinitundrae TaxID=468913 RepID=UPI00137ABF9C|nr:GIY-YIG nuclease family protein [Deinococcus alpinitundrae]
MTPDRIDQTPRPRAYKNFTPRMGVYALRFASTGQVLTDWSPHVEGSLNRLRFQLDAGLYPDKDIQRRWTADGPDAFGLEVLDELAYDPARPADHDYSAELTELEALHREHLHLPQRPRNARGLR